MGVNLWLSCCLLLMINIPTAVSVREILQDFMTTSSDGSTFEPSNATVVDKDSNSVKPTVEKLDDNILLRVDTMPEFDDPDATKLKEDNYIFLPYISNPTGNSMFRLEYTFSHVESCPTYSHSQPVQCKDSLTLALVSTTQSEDVTDIDVTGSALFTHTLLEGSDKVENHHISIPASTTGFRLVVHDEGSSYLIKHLTINRYYCEYIHDPHAVAITCPNSPAANGTTPTVQCTCDSNSSPSNGNATIEEECAYSRNTESADFTRAASSTGVYCKCDTGYVFTLATATTPVHCAAGANEGKSSTTQPSSPSGSSAKTKISTTDSSANTLLYDWMLSAMIIALVLHF